MKAGDVVCAKSFEHRQVMDVTEDKNGKQKVRANRYGFKFQGEHNLLSEVGVFLFLGKFPEQMDADITFKFAESQLRRLGWKTDEPTPAVDAVGEAKE